MSRLVVLLAVSTIAVAGGPSPVETASALAEITRKIHISAVDGSGAAVTDLTAADITLKEGGKDRPVASLQATTAPMTVALLVDDAGTGAFQSAVAQFLQKTHGRGQFSISLLSPQAIKLVDFTDDVEALRGAVGRLGVRGRVQADGDQMLEAISDAAKRLQARKAERPIIIAMTAAGGPPHSIEPDNVLSTLRQSGAALNVVFATGADLGMVMGDGPRLSGGRLEQASSGVAIVAATLKIADSLLNQYAVTYVLPDGVKMSDRITVSTSRKRINLTAPTRLPDK